MLIRAVKLVGNKQVFFSDQIISVHRQHRYIIFGIFIHLGFREGYLENIDRVRVFMHQKL